MLQQGQVAVSGTSPCDRVGIRETKDVDLDRRSVPRLRDGTSFRRIRASRCRSRGWVRFLDAGAVCQRHPTWCARGSVSRVQALGSVADSRGL